MSPYVWKRAADTSLAAKICQIFRNQAYAEQGESDSAMALVRYKALVFAAFLIATASGMLPFPNLIVISEAWFAVRHENETQSHSACLLGRRSPTPTSRDCPSPCSRIRHGTCQRFHHAQPCSRSRNTATGLHRSGRGGPAVRPCSRQGEPIPIVLPPAQETAPVKAFCPISL